MAFPKFHTPPELAGEDYPVNLPLCTLTLVLVPHPDSPPPADVADDPTINYIRTEYHPGSGKAAKICPYEENDPSRSHQPSARHTCVADPWWPFYNTREDFLLSEVLREGSLSNEQMDKLLKVIKRCLSGKGSLMFTTHADVQAAWECMLRQTTLSGPHWLHGPSRSGASYMLQLILRTDWTVMDCRTLPYTLSLYGVTPQQV